HHATISAEERPEGTQQKDDREDVAGERLPGELRQRRHREQEQGEQAVEGELREVLRAREAHVRGDAMAEALSARARDVLPQVALAAFAMQLQLFEAVREPVEEGEQAVLAGARLLQATT